MAELDAIRAEVLPRRRARHPATSRGAGPDRRRRHPLRDLLRPDLRGWFVAGDAFGRGPTPPGSVASPGRQRSSPSRTRAGPQRRDHRVGSGGSSGPGPSPSTGIRVHVLRLGQGGSDQPGRRRLREDPAPIYGGLADATSTTATPGDGSRSTPPPGSAAFAYLELDDGATVDFTGSSGAIRAGGGPGAWTRSASPIAPRPGCRIAAEAGAPMPTPRRSRRWGPLDRRRFREVEATIPEPRTWPGPDGRDRHRHPSTSIIRGSTEEARRIRPRTGFLEVLSDLDRRPSPFGRGQRPARTGQNGWSTRPTRCRAAG